MNETENVVYTLPSITTADQFPQPYKNYLEDRS